MAGVPYSLVHAYDVGDGGCSTSLHQPVLGAGSLHYDFCPTVLRGYGVDPYFIFFFWLLFGLFDLFYIHSTFPLPNYFVTCQPANLRLASLGLRLLLVK